MLDEASISFSKRNSKYLLFKNSGQGKYLLFKKGQEQQVLAFQEVEKSRISFSKTDLFTLKVAHV